jgi:sigma-B regulation protein RsbU (phosphoserine phosphatase)
MVQSQPKPLLLLVDDDIQVLRALEREIRLSMDHLGFNVLGFDDPYNCLDFLREEGSRVFLLISDLRMPRMRGSELLEVIHRDFPEILTILLTAYADLPDLQKAVACSINGLIFKPWTPDQLQAEIIKAWDLFRFRREHRRMESQLKQQLLDAAQFQQQLFATSIPENSRYAFSIWYRPVDQYQVGGDLYQVVPLSGGKLLLLLGDVSGHGIKPALVGAMVKTLYQGYLLDQSRTGGDTAVSPAALVSHLNTGLCSLMGDNRDILVAFTAMLIDPSTNTLTVCGAGQPPVFIIRGDSAIPLASKDPALGVMLSSKYRNIDYPLLTGDRVILFTDGLIEDESRQKRMSHEQMMSTVLRSTSEELSAKTLARGFLMSLGSPEFHDDSTLIALEVMPVPVQNQA